MLKIGSYNNFKVVRGTSRGWHLEAEDETLFVPRKELPLTTQEGHRVKLFVYNKGDGKITATSDTPYAQVGQFAYLRVKEITGFGLFMDWGIKKDLFVPKRFVPKKPDLDSSHIVRLLLDDDRRSVIGSFLVDDYLEAVPGPELREKQQARLLISGIKDIGFRVIINDKYKGMLYKDKNSHLVRYGDKKQGYILKIRRDGLIDVSLERS